MTRLPNLGGDDGNWGAILNEYLSQSHNNDGSLKSNIITAAQLAPNAVTATILHVSGGSDGQALTKDTTAVSGFSWKSTPDATTTTKGVVQLAGDLSGTAASPVVSGLAGKYTKPSSGIPASDLTTAAQTALTDAGTAVQSVNGKSGTSVTLSATDVGAASALSQLSDVSSSGATDGQSLVFNGGSWGPSTVAAGSPAVNDATTTTKGVVQLAGDLGGTAALPTVPGLAAKANTSDVYTKSQVDTSLGAKLDASQKGAVSGVASLDSSGKVPSAQLPDASSAVISVAGKTGVVTLVKADVGLSNVDNTTDAAKPISSATQTALSGKANNSDLAAKAADNAVVHNSTAETIAGVKTFSSSPVVPTPTTNTQAANKGYVDTAVSGAGGGSGYSFVSKTADYTASNNDFVFVDSTAGAVTITLPAPAANAAVTVKRLNPVGNGVQVAAPNGSYIDAASGVGTVTVNSQYQSNDFISDGTNWYRI